MDVFVGLDSGTTSTKAVTAGAGGLVRDVVSVGYPLEVHHPGWAELDPVRLQSAAEAALGGVVRRARERGDSVVGLCLSAAMHGLVPLAEDGTPLGPLVTWADGRAAAQASRLVEDGRAHSLHARTGTPVHPMSPMVKLAWWSENDPGLVAATPRWGGVKELLVTALCGPTRVVDLSSASASGGYDLLGGRWDAEALDIAGVRESQLSEVVSTTHVLPGLRREVATRVGLPVDVPVVIGATDGVLANLGVGAVRPQVAAVSIGTSGALRVVVARPTVDPSGRLFCYALTDDLWVLGGAVNNGGSVVRWAAQAFVGPFAGQPSGPPTDRPGGLPPDHEAADDLDARLLAEAATVPAGSDGLLCLPYLLGERAPWWRAGMRGAYLGLRREHRRPHLVRAALEGVCQQLALVRDAFDEVGLPVTEVRATGGSVASPLWVKTLAAALDLPVRIADSPEGTGLGACLLGMHALGALPDLDDATSLVAVNEPLRPDPRQAALYRELRPLVTRSTLALAEVFEALDTIAPTLAGATEEAP